MASDRGGDDEHASGKGMHDLFLAEDFVRFASASLDLFCVADTQGYFRWLSPRWSETLGWTDEELCARPFIELVHPEDVAATLDEVEKLATGTPTIQFVNRYRCSDGRWVWFEWTTTPTDDGYLYATARDITERMQASIENEKRVHLLEMSLRLSNLGYWEIDLIENTISWSPEIFVIHGLDPKTHVPSLDDGIDRYHPDDRPKVQDAVQRAIDEGEPFSFELRIVRPWGEIRQVESHGEALRNARGDVTRVVGVFRDLTDDPTYKRNRELEQFAFLASHDLKEPLRTITTYMDLLRDDGLVDLQPPASEYWSFVRESAGRMSVLIRDLLRFARAGGTFDPEPVALPELVAVIVADLGQRIAETSARIEGHQALPTVKGEPERLRLVFQNLIENALKFCENPVLRFEATQAGSQWEITITDNGPGIEPEFHQRVFEPFQRLQHDKPGTGMGLAIVDRIVRECGGSIWIDSEQGRGATFHLVFDRA